MIWGTICGTIGNLPSRRFFVGEFCMHRKGTVEVFVLGQRRDPSRDRFGWSSELDLAKHWNCLSSLGRK